MLAARRGPLVVGRTAARFGQQVQMPTAQGRKRRACSVIFTGHMIDLPTRESSRFPPHLEAVAGKAIGRALRRLGKEFDGDIVGVSSAARGGDLLFLESCRQLKIETFVVIPFSRATFAETSVEGVP